ncbi:MAG: carboxypeptidase-like regulatory domain-containing protein, partial [Kofleriaceae bacterium]
MTSKRLGAVLGLVALVLGAWLLFFRHHDDKSSPKAGRANNKVPSLATQHAATQAAAPTSHPEWSLDLDPEGPLQLEGQVVDGDGHGVGGAEVWLGSVPPRTVKTEGDGTFSFDKLVGRTYRLTARSGDQVGGPIVYKLTQGSDPAILQLAGAAKLTVTVRDDKHAPIANADVTADEEDGVKAKTGADGTATLSPVHPGWVSAHAVAEGYAPNSAFTSVGSANATGHIDIVLHTGVAVTGLVVDEQHKPIAKARVTTAGLWNLGSAVEPVTSDAHGKFALVLAAGTHTLVAVDSEHAPARSKPVVISTKAVDGIEIVMKAGGHLAGRVVDAKHQPVAYATVRTAGKGTDMGMVPRRQTTTGKDGTFELRGLTRTKLDVRAESDVSASKIVSFDLTPAPDKTGVELLLDVTGTIAGIVVDDKGAPVPEVTVSSTPDVWGGADAEGLALAGFATATTDGAGAFTIHGLPDGPYKLAAARHMNERRGGGRTDGTSAKTGDANVKLVLASPGSIKGMIAKADGRPPTFATARTGSRAGTPTSESGAFELDELEPGAYDVTLHGPEFADVIKRDVKVEAGKPTDLGTINVARGRILTGKVVDANGAPIAGAHIRVGDILFQFQGAEDQMSTFEDASGVRSAYTDQDGAFSVIGIPKKQCNTMADSDKGRSDAVAIAAGEDDPPPVTLQLHGFGTIVGKVTSKGQPATGVAITDTPKAGGAQLQVIQADETGGFTITKATEGAHVLSAMQQGGMTMKSTSTTVAVTSGTTTNVTIDIPIGTISLTVAVKPTGQVDAAQIFLFRGAVAATTAKDVETGFLNGGVAGMKFWTAAMPAQFDELVA